MSDDGASDFDRDGAGDGPRSLLDRLRWPTLVACVSLASVYGVFTVSRIFFVRDLSFVRWPEHLWFRDAIRAGVLPLWDPYVGFGQSAIADPARHLLFPPTLLLRLLLPTVVGFNLSVALPFPICALGMYVLLRRRLEHPAAALGAIAFAVSGPVLSTGNFINMTWVVALIPWVLVAVERLSERFTARRFALLAFAIALQFLAGEAVTLVATAVLATCYAAVSCDFASSLRVRLLSMVAVVGAGVAAIVVSAAQALPLVAAAGRSSRSGAIHPGLVKVWALHPLTLVEMFAPAPFGDPLGQGDAGSLWLGALNSGREPFILSIYIGVGVLALALAGALAFPKRRLAIFWSIVFLVAVIFALGPYTPVYPALQAVVPLVQALRYTSKYSVIASLAASILAAYGWSALFNGSATLTRGLRGALILLGACAACALVLTVGVYLFPDATRQLFESLAAAVTASSPDVAAKFLLKSLGMGAPRLLALCLGAAGAIWLGASAREERSLGRIVLFAMIAADLVMSGVDLNPTIEAARMGEPAWVERTRQRPDERIYIGGRLSSAYDYRSDPDDPIPEKGMEVTDDSAIAVSALNSVFFATFPSSWRLRDSMSFDNNLLWPREYGLMVRGFRDAPQAQRVAFLRRASVRYFLVPWRSWEGSELQSFPERAPLFLYDGGAPEPRARIVTEVEFEADTGSAVKGLFSEGARANRVALESGTGESFGSSGTGASPFAAILVDGTTRVSVSASVPEGGGYLVLSDTYSPDWNASVDGSPADTVRADGLFRSVRLSPGPHTVEFTYMPRSLVVGSIISAIALAILTAMALRRE